MVEVKRIGSYLETDKNGCLIPVADAGKIGEIWRPAVEMLVRGYRERWGKALHSVYLRGSLVKGQAVEGFSDLDSFGVLHSGVEIEEAQPWRRDFEAAIVRAFPFVAGVELGSVPLEEVLDRSNIYAFIVKTEAACVYGDNLATQLGPYRITPEVAFQTKWFGRHLDLFLKDYPDALEAKKPKLIVWLMRRFLRLGMELVMIDEGRFTRDLYLCHESFTKHYPEQERNMYRALELALNPETGPLTEAFIRDFGSWLEREAERKLALWRTPSSGAGN